MSQFIFLLWIVKLTDTTSTVWHLSHCEDQLIATCRPRSQAGILTVTAVIKRASYVVQITSMEIWYIVRRLMACLCVFQTMCWSHEAKSAPSFLHRLVRDSQGRNDIRDRTKRSSTCMRKRCMSQIKRITAFLAIDSNDGLPYASSTITDSNSKLLEIKISSRLN